MKSHDTMSHLDWIAERYPSIYAVVRTIENHPMRWEPAKLALERKRLLGPGSPLNEKVELECWTPAQQWWYDHITRSDGRDGGEEQSDDGRASVRVEGARDRQPHAGDQAVVW